MVSDTLQEDQKYKSFLTESDFVEVSKLKEPGAFPPPPHLTEFIVKVTSDILKIPIAVILSCSKFTVQTVIPKELISCTPIIIACRTDNNFHYSCTQPQQQEELEDNIDVGEKSSSIPGGDNSSGIGLEKKAVQQQSNFLSLIIWVS